MATQHLVSRAALLLGLALPLPALAEGYLQISAEGDVAILLNDQGVGNLDSLGTASVMVDSGVRHALKVETNSGVLLAERSVEVVDGATLMVHWTGDELQIKSGPTGFTPTSYTSRTGSQDRRSPSAMQTAQAGATIAGIVMPASPGVSALQTGLSAVSAGGTMARTAQSASSAGRSGSETTGPAATSAKENHGTESLQQSGFDPYEATGDRPTVDESLASVTFVVPPGTELLVSIDGQTVAQLGAGDTEETVAVVPGVHKVMILDASGANVVHRGYLTATAGYVFELHFSATEPPVSTIPDTWR